MKPIRFLVFLALLSACQSESELPDPDLLGYDYYPYHEGDSRTYKVREITYNVFETHDTATYQLRESVVGQFVDNAGEVNFELKRETRLTDADDWVTDSLWTTYITANQAVLNKNGQRIIALVFPANNDTQWNALALNNTTPDTYTIQAYADPYVLNGIQYDETLTVVQENKLDSISTLDYRTEVYGKGIGLVQKVDSQLIFCQDNSCFGLRIVHGGRYYIQELLEYEEGT